jgi:hypothetical protein
VNDPAEYARQVERFLCQRNHGHLIRLVGPAFELVCGWAAAGVPLKVAFKGIERCCERLEARGPRRRPVRIEFCEADVLDAFDDWRRAVGVATAASGEGDTSSPPPRKPALAAHIERVIARLAHARGAGAATTRLQHHLEQAIRDLEQTVPAAGRARGDARAEIITRLARTDDELMAAAASQLDEERAEQLRLEAGEELAAFGNRLPPDARARAIEAAFGRLVREHAGLPTIRYE